MAALVRQLDTSWAVGGTRKEKTMLLSVIGEKLMSNLSFPLVSMILQLC